MSFLRSLFLVACGAFHLGLGALLAQHQQQAGEAEKIGKVNFPVSCDPALQPQFNRTVALLHSFWYEKAAEGFAAVAEKDPACGMAYWGIAMTHYHAICEAPGPADLRQGWAAVEKAKAAGARTPRERDYIAAIETFYRDSGKRDHHTRALAYEKAMEQLQASYPEDREAAIFYALAIRANAPSADKTYANQKKAGAILEKIFPEQPEHPGIPHYLIYCYDYPTLAEKALEAARRYARIAPDSPHALHMPSHIFTRLGLWQESIESNLASASAARKHGAPGDELHARDYLVYAYLQSAQDREAKELLHKIPQLQPDDPAYFAGLYAMGTMSARFAVERRQWAEAATLILPFATFPGGRYAWAESNLHYARALGAAHSGNLEDTQNELRQLAALRAILVQTGEKYWAEQVEIQQEVVSAWLTFAAGDTLQALNKMRAAADHEDSTDKHPVTPGVITPARELLGDMLRELNRPAEALTEYQATLRSAPNRFNALSGAAHAAEKLGDLKRARIYYTQLLALCAHADGDRTELEDARTFLDER
jgi:tetratricopeptide (TPR) repeat protein